VFCITFVLVIEMISCCDICHDDTWKASAAKGFTDCALPLGMGAILAFPISLMEIPRPDVNCMSLVKLIGKKKEIKGLLREFDRRYLLKHQQLPLKADKEQIRVLYDYYKAIKRRIAVLEVGGSRNDGNWVVVVAGGSSWIPDTRRFERNHAYDVVAEVNDLAELFAAKRSLHSTLSTYERDFHTTNGRQVSSLVDVKPIAPEYEKYKTIKRMIAILTDAP
jgi:hypothetical protein